MKLKIFSIFDSKAKAFLPPFFLPEPEVAIRTFTNAANDKKHAFGANPADYTLFLLGEFDDDTAKIVTKATPRNLGIAQQFVVPSDQLDLYQEADIIEGAKRFGKGNEEGKKL